MDIRIVKTKNKLTNSLILLLKEKKLKDITVLELCKKANINRTTFYKYYKDISDLTLQIEDQLLIELKEFINGIQRNYLISYTSKIIETIAEHKDIYSRLLGDNGDYTFLRRIIGQVYNESLNEWEKLLKKATRNDLEKIYNFIVDGTIGIVEDWIRNKCQEEPTAVSIFINKICMSGLSSFV